MHERPLLFIGSSTNGLEVATTLKQLLTEANDPPLEIELWREAFDQSGTTISTLEAEIDRCDYAILVLTDDDVIDGSEPGQKSKVPRDNVIFELGLFMGRLTGKRCRVVYDTSRKLKLPSDLAGVNASTFKSHAGKEYADQDLRKLLAEPCETIRRWIRTSGGPLIRIPQSVRFAWEADRKFGVSIEGYWWSLRHWDKDSQGFPDSFGFVRIATVDSVNFVPEVHGDVYRQDGSHVAEWDSDASCTLAAKRKLHYSFNGKHYPTAGHDQAEEYRGFTTYEFDPPPPPLELRPMSGKGELSDRNVPRKEVRTALTLTLTRCTDRDIETMIRHKNEPEHVAEIARSLLPRPTMPSRVVRRD